MTNRALQFASAIGLPFLTLAGAANADTATGGIKGPTQLGDGWAGAATVHPVRNTPSAFPRNGKAITAPYGLMAFCHYLRVREVEQYRTGNLKLEGRRLRPECLPFPTDRPNQFTIDPAMPEGRANAYTLEFVQKYVNEAIQAATDDQMHGVSEFWRYPYDRGDCEDYALLKRLIASHIGEYLRNKPGARVRIAKRGDGILEFFEAIVKIFESNGANMTLLKNNTLTERSFSLGVVNDEKGEGHAILLARTNRGTHLVLDNKFDTVREWADTPYSAISSSGPGGLLQWHNAR